MYRNERRRGKEFLFTFSILFKYLFPTSNLKGEYLLKRENIGKGKGHVCLLDAVKPLLTLVVSFFLFFFRSLALFARYRVYGARGLPAGDPD